MPAKSSPKPKAKATKHAPATPAKEAPSAPAAKKAPATPALRPTADRHGFIPPTLAPPSGDATFDKALAELFAKAEASFKRNSAPITQLPARLKKLGPGDEERLLAQLDPAVIDLGNDVFDLARGDDAAYMTAWRAVRAVRIPREIQLATLARIAVATEAGQHQVCALIAANLDRAMLLRFVLENILPLPLPPATLEACARALEAPGVAREIHMTWVLGAKAALRLPTARAIEVLVPYFDTEKEKAVFEAMGRGPLDSAWKQPLKKLPNSYYAGKALALVA
ncbi:MAG: hypothetical protein AB7T06_40030 [Kofleriaceae bacterium]